MSPGRSASVAVGLVLATWGVGQAAAPVAPTTGATATYRWTSSLTRPVSVVVREHASGGQVTWSVVRETLPPPPLFVTYSIVRGTPKTYTLQVVTLVRPGSPPLSVTQVTVDRRSGRAVRSLIQHPGGVSPTAESGLRPLHESDVPDGRRDEVTVPAGRFDAVHGRLQGAEVWVSDRVPGLGLVKAVWPSGTLELIESATTGARDLLGARTR